MSTIMKSKAAEWFVRLRAPDVSEDERQAYAHWLAENPAHRRAMDAVEAQWRELDGLRPWARQELQRLEVNQLVSRKSRWLTPKLISAATVALAVLVIVPLVVLNHDERFATEKGERRQVVLDDGSRVHLNSSSVVDVQFDRRERALRLRKGEGLFDVAHDPGRMFVVQVPGSRVVAVGTRFNVRYLDGELAVTVLEGKVMVVPERKQLDAELLLMPNQQARVALNGEVEAVKTVDAAKLTAWDRGLLIFDNTPLRQVVKELSRYVSGEIRIATDVPDHPVTGTIKIRDQETMLRILAEVAPITPVRTSAMVITLVPTSSPSAEQGI